MSPGEQRSAMVGLVAMLATAFSQMRMDDALQIVRALVIVDKMK